MNPEDLGKAYDQITHLWSSNNFNSDNGIAEHKRALVFTKNKNWALDVGCGCNGRFLELLRKKKFKIEGVDISKEMIRQAKNIHKEFTFYHEDICEWALPRKYDFITAWDSIWHIPIDKQINVLIKLLEGLNVGGVFIFSCAGVDEQVEKTDNFMGPNVYYASLGLKNFIKTILELDCAIRHFEYDLYPELHAYFIVQKL